jgi:hypothetical protein
MTSDLDQDLLDDAGWSAAMADHCRAFQAVWAEHGGAVSQTPGWRDEIKPNLPQDMQDGIDAAQPYFEDVPPRIGELFETFCSGRIEQAAAIHGDLAEAASLAGDEVDAGLDTLKGEMSASWHGDAADGFERWLGDMQRACENMSEVVLSARELMNAYQQLLRSYRSDILTLIDDVQARLTDAGLVAERRRLGMLGTIQQIGLGLLGVSSVQGAAISVGGALAGQAHNDSTMEVTGEEEGEVILSMLTEGEKIVADARAAGDRIVAGLLELGEYVTDTRDDRNQSRLDQIRPGRPSLITDEGFDPEDFRHEEQPPGVADRVSRDDLVREPPPDEDRDAWRDNPPPDREPEEEYGLGIDPGPPPLADRDPYPEQ